MITDLLWNGIGQLAQYFMRRPSEPESCETMTILLVGSFEQLMASISAGEFGLSAKKAVH